MFEAHIEANMYDAETAQFLSEDQGWLQAQWPECIRQAEQAEEIVNGDPVLQGFSLINTTSEGNFYDFVFGVPIV